MGSWGVGDQGEAVSTLSSSSSSASVQVQEVAVTQAKRPAAAAVAAATVATTTARKRAKHSKSTFDDMSYHDLVAHFGDTEEVTDEKGNKKFFVYCIYCGDAYNQYQTKMQTAPAGARFFHAPVARVPPPKRIHRMRRDMANHLKKCYYTAQHLKGPFGTTMARRDSESAKSVNTAPSVKTPVVQKRSGPMGAFVIPAMTQPEIHTFQQRFVESLVDAALPPSLGDRKSIKRLFDAVRPGSSLHLPGRTKATRILHELADNAATAKAWSSFEVQALPATPPPPEATAGAPPTAAYIATPPGSDLTTRLAALEAKVFGQPCGDLDLRTRLIQLEQWTWGVERTGAAVQRIEQLEQSAG